MTDDRAGQGAPILYLASRSPRRHELLAQLGIASAVTTDTGFNGPDTPKGELRRILDSEAMAPIEFEAEVCGFRALFR